MIDLHLLAVLLEQGKQPGVIYTPEGGQAPEYGVATSMNESVVFVRYAGDNHSKATFPSYLQFLVRSDDV